MANYDSNYAIAQEISARIGVSPIPFDSVYSIALEIYNELGGEPAEFDSVYSILLGILPLVEGGVASKVIDDNVITTVKTWSSSKINSELSGKASVDYVDEQIEAVIGAGNSDIEGKETEDFTFVQSLPVSGEEGQQVIIKGDNADTLYKYVSGEWVEQTPDATKLYFDTENEALYSYVTAEHQFAPVSLVNTIVVGSNLNSNVDLKALKTVGVYNVVQRLHNATKGDYVKNWTLYVESIDYEEYDRSDSVYQRLVSNYTIQKRTWSATRATNDGWSNFSTYYAGEIKDTTTSKYYTWSSSKINSGLTELDEKIDNVKPIEEVSELPNASENTDKLFRLDNGEKDVYAAKLLSSETITTNRLPDAQQIDKGYLYEYGDCYYYKGAYKIVCSDGEIDGYLWGEDYVTIDNTETVTENTISYMVWEGVFDSVNKTVTFDTDIASFKGENETTPKLAGVEVIYATYNAPEANQIGNATLEESDNNHTGIYNGTEVTFTDENEIEQTGYKWIIDGETDFIVSDKSASEIVYMIRDEGEHGTFADTDTIFWLINSSDSSSTRIYLSNLYIPQLNAPDSEQVGAAYVQCEHGTGNYYYIGTLTAIDYDGQIPVTKYAFKNTNDEIIGINFAPSTLYTLNYSSVNVAFYDSENYDEPWWLTEDTGSLTNYSTVKYQRTETIEEWDWQPLTDNATNDDIDAMFVTPESPVVKRVLMKDSEDYGYSINEGWINFNDETMSYDGGTYYKWNKYSDIGGEAAQDNNYYILTDTLNPTLPFDVNSNECVFDFEIESEGVTYRIESNETYSKIALIHEDGSITYEE